MLYIEEFNDVSDIKKSTYLHNAVTLVSILQPDIL